MFLKKWMECLEIVFRMRISRYKESRTDTLLGVLSSFLYLALNILFWVIIGDAGFVVEGWTQADIFVFVAFSEFFFGLDNAVFSMTSRFWYVIYAGGLDVLLTKPQDPRIRFLLLNTDFLGILTAFLSCIILLLLSGKKLMLTEILLGMFFVILANVVLALIRQTLSYAAFWQGKMEAVCEFSDSLTRFNKYPLVIMPKLLRRVFQCVVPFYFFSTFSAELVNGFLSTAMLFKGFAMLIVCGGIWWYIHSYVWKRGLQRYESIQG